MQYSMTDPSYGTVKVDSISGAFTQLSVYQLASASQGNVSMMQQGSCTVYQTSGTGSASGGSATALDAGTVTITGPSGSGLTNTALTKTSNTYALTTMEGLSGIPGQITFTLPPGGYTLNGAGGTDVGTFTTSMTLPTPVTLTSSLPATVVRSNPLTLNWTGGNSSDLVEITGSSSTGSGASAATTAFICLTTAGARTFTVPASILTQLPASANGGLTVLSGTYNTTFTTQLKSNSSNITGYFGSFVGTGAAPAYQ